MGMRFSVPSLALHLSPSHLCAACVCRPEMVVGWYHSHPGFGCWLSGVDINTQQVSGVKWCPGRLALGIHFDCTASNSKFSCAEGAREPSCFNCCCQAAEVLIPLPLAVTAPPAHAIHLLAHFPPPPPKSFEALNQRAVAVVVDPVQSVKGKVGAGVGMPRPGWTDVESTPTHTMPSCGGAGVRRDCGIRRTTVPNH